MPAFWTTLRRKLTGRGNRTGLDHRDVDAVRAIAQRAKAEPFAFTGERAANLIEGLGRFVVATERLLGIEAFDVQIQAALAMARGEAVEMQTGEGKTLATAAAAATLALQGRQVHLATVNRYLAERDFRLFGPVIESLGLRVGLIYDNQPRDRKLAAYACPVVYGTGYEFGFDYLRDQLQLLKQQSPRLGERYRRLGTRDERSQPCQGKLDCIIVDELDSVLLDEACVPLVLSEASAEACRDAEILILAREAARTLVPTEHFFR